MEYVEVQGEAEENEGEIEAERALEFESDMKEVKIDSNGNSVLAEPDNYQQSYFKDLIPRTPTLNILRDLLLLLLIFMSIPYGLAKEIDVCGKEEICIMSNVPKSSECVLILPIVQQFRTKEFGELFIRIKKAKSKLKW